MFDNRIFRMNGQGLENLALAIKLACKQESTLDAPIDGWSISGNYGFILYSHFEELPLGHPNLSTLPVLGRKHPFPLSTAPPAAANMVWEWLALPDTWKNNVFEEFTGAFTSDGDSSQGWLVYCDRWGHIASDHTTICGIKPCHLWYGK